MKCINCSKKTSVSLKHLGSFCSGCFTRIIEKRIRKDLSINKVFSPNDKVLLINDGSLKAMVSEYILKSISKDIPLRIDIKREKTAKKYDKIVTSDSLDNDIEEFLVSIFKKNPFKKSKEVHLLRTISDKELLVFAKILKIKGTIKKTKLGKILDQLENKYPGSKFGLFRSIKEKV
jgi:sulfur transfer complex TusBCD TusB component (DsrH family)